VRASLQQVDALRGALGRLRLQGMNLQRTLFSTEAQRAIPEIEESLSGFGSVLIIGSAGPSLWDVLQAKDTLSDDPIDTHCLRALNQCQEELSDHGINCRVLWHGGSSIHLPVQALGEAAGWARQSRMGLSIHGEHGLWFAYRGVLLLGPHFRRDVVAGDSVDLQGSPCVGCPESPCVSSCPAGAVGGPSGIEADLCFTERDREGALCADRCLSRLACPVGVGSQYSLRQIAHHHAAVESLRDEG